MPGHLACLAARKQVQPVCRYDTAVQVNHPAPDVAPQPHGLRCSAAACASFRSHGCPVVGSRVGPSLVRGKQQDAKHSAFCLTHARTHARTHTRTHARARTRTHAHARTHALSRAHLCGACRSFRDSATVECAARPLTAVVQPQQRRAHLLQ
jgi:hypothetical protein